MQLVPLWSDMANTGAVGQAVVDPQRALSAGTCFLQGAGHMVPTDQPLAAFTMFSRFIKNEPY